jgi:AAA family ATP:ADP antiporter
MIRLRISILRFLRSTFGLRRGESGPVLTAAGFFFCVLTALMLLRPVRDALGMERGIESVRWLFLGTAVVTLAVNPLFGWLVSRLKRAQFIGVTYGFFALSLCGFWGLLMFAPGAVGRVSGQVFYVWFSVFNLFATSVVWSLLADRFSSDQAKRLFALIAMGGTLGAIVGPWLTSWLAEPLGTPSLLLVAAGFLILATAAATRLIRGGRHQRAVPGSSGAWRHDDQSPLIGGNAWAGVRAIAGSRYLAGIAAYVLLVAVMTAFVYFARLQMVADVAGDMNARAAVLGNIDMWTQIVVLVLQLTLTGRIIRRFGPGVALAALPLATAAGFLGLAISGSFLALIVLEAANRAVERGIARPARESLFTVVPREDKYKAKALIDTFVYRAGDVVGAQSDGLLTRLGMATGALLAVTAPLLLVWAALGLWLGRAYGKAGASAERDSLRPMPPPADVPSFKTSSLTRPRPRGNMQLRVQRLGTSRLR